MAVYVVGEEEGGADVFLLEKSPFQNGGKTI